MESLFVAGSSKPTTADDLEFDNIKEYFSHYIRLDGNLYSTRHKDKFALFCGQIFLNNYISITATQLISMQVYMNLLPP